MAVTEDRPIPNIRMRHVLLAVQDVMGRNGLMAVLKSAQLERYVRSLPPANWSAEASAAELSRLVETIETQYGRGARGQLTRIGYSTFQHLAASDRFGWGRLALLMWLLPKATRRRLALDRLARYLAAPGGNVRVYQQDERLLFEDAVSDDMLGRSGENDASNLTIGLLQACLEWATDEASDVTQVAHKSRGDPASQFEIGASFR